MGPLDHQEQVRALIVDREPANLAAEDASYLESIIADGQTVRFFTEFARGEAWLSRALQRRELDALFDPRAERSTVTWHLAEWMATHYVTEDFSDLALAVVREAGGRLGLDLWDAIVRRLAGPPRPSSKTMRPWLVLLARESPDQMHNSLQYLLPECSFTEDPESALFLMSHLTEPQLRLGPSVFGGSRFEIHLRGEDYWLQEAATRVPATSRTGRRTASPDHGPATKTRVPRPSAHRR